MGFLSAEPAGKREPKGRLLAIGDIHGCAEELATMLKAIAPASGDTIVFIGDYVDRGPSAHDAIEVLLTVESSGAQAVFLKGNHEDMMLSFLGLPGHYGESFLFNGGADTLESYGIHHYTQEQALEQLPAQHLDFLKHLTTSYHRPPFFFVHAGILPSVPLDQQVVEDMLWIRHEFIHNRHRLDATIVFGHTPMREILVDLPYKLGIDTGLVYGGKLSCVDFTQGVVHQVARRSTRVRSRALKVR